MSERESVRGWAPATLSNLGSGFDVLGLALEGPGDVVTARRVDRPGVHLAGVEGDDGRLPRTAEGNTAGIAAAALLAACGAEVVSAGVELTLHKGLPLASGLGSSAASAVAATVAVDALFGLGAGPDEMLAAALEGEAAACGARHPDNAAPCLFGGWVLIPPGSPPHVLRLPVPEAIAFAVVRPHVELPTREMRALLPREVPLGEAIRQWGHLGALVHALHTGDLDLLARSMVDAVAEPRRAPRVPGFAPAREAALGAGALAFGLSGSGPSLFALAADRATAAKAADAMVAALAAEGLAADRIVSGVDPRGARVLDEDEAVPGPAGPEATTR